MSNNTKRVLFISYSSGQHLSGGTQCVMRNRECIEEIFGKENTRSYFIRPIARHSGFKAIAKHWFYNAKCYMAGLTDNHIDEITDLIKQGGYDTVFIDSSQLGILAKTIRRVFSSINIYVFFQNIEYDYFKSVIIQGKDYLRAYWIPIAKLNEYYACQFANGLITLTEHDGKRMQQLYHRKPDIVIPITMHDDYTFEGRKNIGITDNGQLELLFVGSFFPGNTNGLQWFCKTVLPQTKAHLTIVGSGMDKFSAMIPQGVNVSIHSNVPDLTPYYEQSDVVISPIISGGGMKVKTAEALKYGKFIIGTREAFEGYDVNNANSIECHTSKEFIQAITHYSPLSKYCEAARVLFKEKYSHEASLKLFKHFFSIF